MNHVYRLRWSRALGQWTVVSELARRCAPVGNRKLSSVCRLARGLPGGLAAAILALQPAWAGPSGGQVVAGSGTISQSGATTTIEQESPVLSIGWQSFNVGPQETVSFVQPSSSAIAVNRIASSTGSEILGHLDANGQVWLINPNGVLFGEHAQVDVGGLIASTLDLVGGSGGTREFSGAGGGTVVNEGTLSAASGGYIALLGHQVSNEGIITAQLGTVALGAGSAETLTFSGDRLLHVQVDAGTLNDLAENRQLIEANGGQVLMTAGAKDSLLASAVNNTGIVQAETVEDHGGTISLLAGGGGAVHVGGVLDASAPRGGDGGSIETSGAQVSIEAGARIDAGASSGRAGTWLVDPTNLTIDSAAAATIDTALDSGTNVTEQTTSSGASGAGQQSTGLGDIDVEAPISWSNAAATLTLSAYHAINVDAAVSGAGQIVMDAAGGNLTLAAGASVSGQSGVTLGTGADFINDAGAAAVSAGSGARWLVYSTNPTLDQTGGLAPAFIQYDAAFDAAPQGIGNGFLYSVAPVITITALTGSVAKTYDATTTANLSGSNITASGLLNGDTVSAAVGTYATPDAGSSITVTAPTAASSLTILNGAIPVYGYTLAASAVSAPIGTIAPAPLEAAIVGDPTKVYDGTTTATLGSSNYLLTGFVAGQGATVGQPSAVAYDSTEAGSRTVTATLASTNFTASSGTNLSNYVLPTSATGAGVITPAPVDLSGVLAEGKTYDGTTTAVLDTSRASIFGVIAPDAGSVSLDTTGAAGVFATANAGGNIPVSVEGFTLTGTKAADYQLIAPSDLTASISPKSLTVTGAGASDKVYDGTTTATLILSSAQLSGVVAGDSGQVTLATGGATGTFASSNVGSNIAVSVGGLSLSGADAGNYTLVQPAGLTASITPAPLTIVLSGNPTKPYNGTTTAVVPASDFTVSGFVGGQSAAISQNALAEYASPNAGNGIPVSVTVESSDFAPASGTSLSNYSFPHTVTGTGTIDPIALAGYITNDPTKTYDGTTTATVASGDYVLSGLIGSESITVTQPNAAYASANAGPETVTATLTSANYTAGNGTLLSNYVLPTTLSGAGTIQPAPLSGGTAPYPIDGAVVGNPTKTYDGTTTATLTSANFLLTGWVGSDGATVTQTMGQYSSANAGSQTVTVSLAPSDFTPTGSTNLANYSLPTVVYGTGTIVPATLTATIVGTPTKVYDGTTTAVLTSANYLLSGFVAGEGATVDPSKLVDYASANAGSQTITAELTSSAFTAEPGTLLSNYVLPTSAVGSGTITPAPLYVTGVSAENKVYDTTSVATLNVAGAGLAGLVSGDAGTVTLAASTTGAFAQSDVGTDIAVTAAGFSISGSGASNYSLQPITGLHADIAPAPLTIAGVTVNGKSYDATAAATLDVTNASLQGVLPADAGNVTLSTSGASGTFASVDAATDLPVTASGFALSGGKAADYQLSQPTGLAATIAPAPITATITGNPIKTYDGSSSATLTAADYTLSGFVAGQSATIPQSATASYLSANAGSDVGLQSTLVVSDFVAGPGTNLANYALPSSASGVLGTITPKVIDLDGTRVYDAATDAAGSLFGVVAGLNGDTLTVTGTGTLTSKSVGTESLASLDTLALSANGSALASNYTLVGGTDWVRITPATLTVTGTVAADKVYDGTTTAALSGATLSGVIGSDAVTLGNDASGTFNSKDVGTDKPVSTAMTISGTDAGNYTLVQPGGLTADITPKTITVAATGANRAYNGGVSDAARLSSSGVVAGDAISFSDTSATFADPNVANGKTVSVSGISASGADASNYVLANTTATTTANITPAILSLTGTRVYDANTDAPASLFGSDGVLTGVDGETLTLTGTGTLATQNVGTAQPFASLAGFTLTGNGSALASNYTLVGGTDWVRITPATLTVTGTVAADKVYDGTTAAALSGATLSGVIGSDAVTLGNDASGTFNSKDVGTDKPVSTAMTISGTDAGNYTLVQPSGLTADITQRSLTVTATGADKVYDGNVSDAATLGSSDVVAGDSVTFSDTSATFADPNVGAAKTVSVSGISVSGADAGNYTLANTTTTTAADITPAVLDLTATRVYDGTLNASASLFGSSGVLAGVDGETLTLTGSGTLSSKNAGADVPFASLAGLALTGNGSALASNYTLVGGTDWVTITQRPITVAATGADKVYDGTMADPGVTLGSGGVLGGDTVDFADTSATFADKNVGSGKTVTVSGISASGADAEDYSFNTTATTTASITPKPITVAASGTNKVYDGTTTDVVSLGAAGVVPGDAISFSDSSAVFGDPNAGAGKTVTVSGITASGSDAGNYSFNNGAVATADITPAVLDLTGTRVYDAGTAAAASLFGNDGVLAGVNGETLTLTGTGTLSSKNAGAEVPLASLTGLALTGNGSALASNYTLAGGTDWVTITPRPITVAATGADKVYDGTIDDPGATVASNGVLPGDVVVFSDTSAVFADKSAGSGKAVTVSGISASGTDADDYSYNTVATTTATITPAPLTVVGAQAADKVYDGTTAATLSGATLSGVIGSDIVTLGDDTTGTFDSKDVGTSKTVTAAMTIGGADAGDYSLVEPSGLTADITPRVITVAATGTNKVYDGNVSDGVALSSAGIVAGDSVGFSDAAAVFADKNVGSGKTVTVTGISATGADAGDYLLASTSATTSADITPKPIVVTATGTDKVYDGTTVDPGVTLSGTGIVAGDEVSFANASADFVDKNVGNGKDVTVAGITASGPDAGNYSYNNIATTTADITPATLTVTGTVAADKVYDGTTTAALSGATLSGVIGSDAVTLGNDASGTFNSKDVGTDKPVSTAMTISGTDAGNYTLVQPAGLAADITPKPIVVTATGSNKVYDGNTADSVTLASSGVVSGDLVSFTAASADFATPSIGNGKAVTVEGIEAVGADAGNYLLTSDSAATVANITSPALVEDTAPSVAYLELSPTAIATPYGVAPAESPGQQLGNEKMLHRSVERNERHDDFVSGLSLRVVDGGVRMPANAP